MGIETEKPVKIKIKSQKEGFNVVIKARTTQTEAIPLTESFIAALKARGFNIPDLAPTTVESKENNNTPDSTVPVCPTHGKELVKRKGQYGDFRACPSKDEDGNWCKWRPEKKKR